ncbi:MAG: leucyl/phenylalanyl-tRNA--protein transferase [Bdellovibrio sp.]|nr:leucyl/phenylalanyl-tRNA--protein transferase [Methylotenera sp.]
MSNSYYQLSAGRVAAIEGDCDFPPLENALIEPNGLIAIGGDLSAARLINAYSLGIFPWYNAGDPIMWFSPNPRMVLYPAELKISNSLKKTINRNAFETRINTSFSAVIAACGKIPRNNQAGTWITDEMVAAYCQLHALGYAMCAEAWQDGQLVGGCYGIKIGRMFYGESMFHTQTDASKVAFVSLVNCLINQQVELIDCQMKTPLLSSFGGREIPRDEFINNLTHLL